MRTKLALAALAAAFVGTAGYWAASAGAGTVNAPRAVTSVAPLTTSPPPRVFAVVNSNGTKVRGKAVASTATLSTGTYDVRFLRNITGCAWTGTIGIGNTPFGGSVPASMISVSGRAGTNNGLFIQTFNSTGALTNLPFSVIVVCS